MPLNIQETLDRAAAIQIEAMASISIAADAVPYFFHWQESGIYFTNRVGGVVVNDDGSEDFDLPTYDIVMRMIVGFITDGFVGDMDDKLYTYIPLIINYFNERQWLQSAAYPTAQNALVRARVTACTGWQRWQNAGVSGSLVGAEFTLTCEYNETIEQAYN